MSFNTLSWGVKASFRNYVEGVGGSVNVSDGACQAEDGTFVFRAVPGGDLVIHPDGSATGATRFQGTVTFDAHGGMLNATIAELGIEGGQEGLLLTVLEAPMNQNRCAIAKLSFTDAPSDNTIDLRAEITMEGMYQIADNYPPGTELDPVHLS